MSPSPQLRSFIQVNAIGRVRGKPALVTAKTSGTQVVRFYLETKTRPILPFQQTQILPVKCTGDMTELARQLRDDEYVAVSGHLLTSSSKNPWKGRDEITCVLLCNQIIRMFYNADEDALGTSGLSCAGENPDGFDTLAGCENPA